MKKLITHPAHSADTLNIVKKNSASSARGRQFTFIDLFAGIGGFRLGLESTGRFRCVFSSEWDKHAQKTYKANFGDQPEGDINLIPSSSVPDHDLLVGGFPCQPFSIAGVSKKNALGKAHGFLDKTQGTLFFEIARILRDKKPRAFLLENVKNLISHDKGRTFQVILSTLKELGYHVHYKVINAKSYVPQNRERIYIAGFLDFNDAAGFQFPDDSTMSPSFRSVLEENPDPRYTLSDNLWNYLQNYKEKHNAAGNGFGYGIANPVGISRTLSARYYKDGSEILIAQNKSEMNPNGNPRRLTPRECARLMGFPDSFIIPVSDTQAYKQFGNSVAVPVIEQLAIRIADAMKFRSGKISQPSKQEISVRSA